MTEYDEEFENLHYGASLTIPISADSIKKGGLMVINGRPCKVVDYSVYGCEDRGHITICFVGIDIFNGRKYVDDVPISHKCEKPFLKTTEYLALCVNSDDYLSLYLGESGEVREDLKLPDETDDDLALSNKIRQGLDEGKTIYVTVLASMGIEKVTEMQEKNQ